MRRATSAEVSPLAWGRPSLHAYWDRAVNYPQVALSSGDNGLQACPRKRSNYQNEVSHAHGVQPRLVGFFKQARRSLAAADAHCYDTVASLAAFHFIGEGAD